jgi:hypothetical protein
MTGHKLELHELDAYLIKGAFVLSRDELGWDEGRGLDDRMQAMTRDCMERWA